MTKKNILTAILLFLILSYMSPAYAQIVGSSADPLLSKSYADQAFSFRVVELKDGTHFKATSGNQIVILTGKVRYVSTTGKELLNLTTGRMTKAGTFLTLNNLYVITSEADFELQIKSPATALIQGISDTNLNLK